MTAHANHIVPVKTYAIVFASLMVLLVLTVFFALHDIPPHPFLIGALIAFTIGLVKAVLIVLYFMHVRYSPKLIWAVAAAGFFWLGILFLLTFSDYLARGAFDVYGY